MNALKYAIGALIGGLFMLLLISSEQPTAAKCAGLQLRQERFVRDSAGQLYELTSNVCATPRSYLPQGYIAHNTEDNLVRVEMVVRLP